MPYKSVPRECATTAPHKSVPQIPPTKVAYKSVLQECPDKVSHKRFLYNSPTRVSRKCLTTASRKSVPQRVSVTQEVPQDLFIKVFYKSVSRNSVLTRVSHLTRVPPTRVSCKRAPRECPTSLPRKSVLQECPIRVFHKSVVQPYCPTRVSRKSVLQEHPTRVSDQSVPHEISRKVFYKSVYHKSARQECLTRVFVSVPQKVATRVSYKIVAQGCPARVFHKRPSECRARVSHIIPQNVSTRVFYKSVCLLQECLLSTRVFHKSVPPERLPQECPRKVSRKSVLQECQPMFGRLFSSGREHSGSWIQLFIQGSFLV